MFVKNLNSTIKIAALLVASATVNRAAAQMDRLDCKNQYPCAECAVFDNNGNDLKTFISTKKADLEQRGSKVMEFSGGNWGFMQVKTGQVPSVASKFLQKGNLNYTQFIRATYVMTKDKDVSNSTWWARECSIPNAPLVNIKVETDGQLDMKSDVYPTVMNTLNTKKFTLVEYYDTMYNPRDYDQLLKNHIMVAAGAVADLNDYKTIVDFNDYFLGKFTYVTDPLLENKGFITFFKGTGKYICYFNPVNGKLSGNLELADMQYEKDKDILVARIFRKLKGKTVFIYGDETFGLDKNIIKYARANNIKLKRRLPANMTKKFNEE